MGKYKDAVRHDIEDKQKSIRAATGRAMADWEASGGGGRFAPSPLQTIDPSFKNISTFLPEGQRSNIGMMNYQGTPGQMYVNAPDHAPGTQWGTDLYPRPSVPPPAKDVPPTDTGGTVPTQPQDDVTGMGPDIDQLEAINASRRELGYPEYETWQDLYDDIANQNEGGPDSWLPPLVANEGGLASLPVYMNIGGITPRSAFQASGDRRSLSARVPGMRRMAMRNLKATSPESGDAQAIPLDQDVIQEIAVGEESIQEAADKLAKTGMPLSKRLERQMRRADRRAARRESGENQVNYSEATRPQKERFSRIKQRRRDRQQRKADRIAAQNDPGGYEQVVSQFAPQKEKFPRLKKFRQNIRDPFGFKARIKESIGIPEEVSRWVPALGGNPMSEGMSELYDATGWYPFQRMGRNDPYEKGGRRYRGPQGRNEGGIVSLPGFSNGDLAQTPNTAETFREKIAGNIGGSGGSGLEGLSREELIRIIKSMGGGNSQGNMGGQLGADLGTIGQGIGKLFGGMGGGGGGASVAAADGGLMYLAHGDMVEDFPRVNGQISGPGTERSDDIPAMLSDGEFVVNAKAVRGIGNIGGANGSKEDQRREGARMMYALQQAGEDAMRRT